MLVNYLEGDLIYIENAFPNSIKFIEDIEEFNSSADVFDVIPPWSRWEDGGPVRIDPNDNTKWQQVFSGKEDSHRGDAKLFDWDLSVNHQNAHWPRVRIPDSYTHAHSVVLDTILLIEEDLKECLKVWHDFTKCPPLDYLTRNYCVRKYRTGGSMGVHVDRNVENPLNTMDWTALIYLNDDYEGGEVVFPDLGLQIKPSAGSILFLPCLEPHHVKPLISGNKYYIFLFLYLDTLMCTALGEPYQGLNAAIHAYRKKIVTNNLEV